MSTITHIACQGLSAGYTTDGPFISKQINFEAHSGELLAIMGPSGAGKSTLIRALLGPMPRKEGHISVNGHDVTDTGLACVKDRVGLVPQDDVLVDELTVRENIASFHAIAVDSKRSAAQTDAAIAACLKDLAIDHIADQRVRKPEGDFGISGGQRKRVNIAMELVNEPDVLIIDEPTSGLSSQDALMLMTQLKAIAGQGRIVIVIIHQPSSDIFKLFDRLLVLDKQGHCVRSGPRDEVFGHFRSLGLVGGAWHCGSCQTYLPERMLETIESKESWSTESQSFGAQFSPSLPKEEALQTVRWLRNLRNPFEPLKDLLALWRRQRLVKRRDRMNLLLTWGAPVVLGLLLATVFKAVPEGASYALEHNPLFSTLLFMLLVTGMFLGLVSSVREVIKDRPMLARERLRGLSLTAYYFAELLALLLPSAIQAALLLGTAFWWIEASHLFWPVFGVFWLAMLISNAMGLLVSMRFNSDIAAFNVIPLLLIPQIILGGALLPYKDMGAGVYLWEQRDTARQPLLGKLMPVSWAYEMTLRRIHDHAAIDGKPINVAVKAIESVPQGGFLALAEERTPLPKLLEWVHLQTWQDKAYARDGLVLMLFLGFFVVSGLVWIRRDPKSPAGLPVGAMFWQGAAAYVFYLAASALTQAVPAQAKPPEAPVTTKPAAASRQGKSAVPRQAEKTRTAKDKAVTTQAATVEKSPKADKPATNTEAAEKPAAEPDAPEASLKRLPGKWKVTCEEVECAAGTWTFFADHSVVTETGYLGAWQPDGAKHVKVDWPNGHWERLALPFSAKQIRGMRYNDVRIVLTRQGSKKSNP